MTDLQASAPAWASMPPALARYGTPQDDLAARHGLPLTQIEFVVVDVETTGWSPAEARITEIGAVRLRAGEVTGEFSTLVDPGMPVPPDIEALTGIEAEDLIELALLAGEVGDHAAGFGPAAGGGVDQDRLADAGEFVQQFADGQVQPGLAGAPPHEVGELEG